MLLSIATFSKLPRLALYFLSSPCRDTDDICLITCEEVKKLSHVVMASDGKYYNCISLYEWIHYGKNYVIPGVSLTHVTLNPLIIYCFRETFALMFLAMQKSKFVLRVLCRNHRRTKTTRRIHSLVRIQRYISNDIKMKKRSKITRNKFTHSHTGPFKCV